MLLKIIPISNSSASQSFSNLIVSHTISHFFKQDYAPASILLPHSIHHVLLKLHLTPQRRQFRLRHRILNHHVPQINRTLYHRTFNVPRIHQANISNPPRTASRHPRPPHTQSRKHHPHYHTRLHTSLQILPLSNILTMALRSPDYSPSIS